MNLIESSKEILRAARNGELCQKALEIQRSISIHELVEQLNSDDERKVFWINLYNAHVIQKFLSLGEQTPSFYTEKSLEIKEWSLSLDDIEHGILRRSKLKASLGYLDKLVVSEEEKQLRVDAVDPRIHFALNCGANSCPPIRFYSLESLGRDLNEASKNYLLDSSVIDIENERVRVPRILLWYLGDFGGYRGIIKLYRKMGLIPPDVKPRVSFLSYDWTPNIDNFATEIA